MFPFGSNLCAAMTYSLVTGGVSVLILLTTFFNSLTPEQEILVAYDWIIVGAGTAGTTVLLEMPHNESVLLIEDGPMTSKFFDVPIFSPMLQRTKYDWSYITTPQKDACHAMKGRQCRLPAGHGFGGSNILNNMIYYRGHKNDFRGWFEDAKDYNYTRDILPLFEQLEDELSIDYLRYRTEFGEAFDRLNSANTFENIVFQEPRVTQKNGYRWTMAHKAKLNLPFKHQILLYSRALKIVFEDRNPRRALGVKILKNNGIVKTNALKGVILTAGTIGTPKILLQSGIGPCNELRTLSIPCRLNLRGVGKNLQDHIATGLDLITLNKTLSMRVIDLVNPETFSNFIVNDGHSQLSTVGCEALGFTPAKKTNENNELPELGFMALPFGISSDAGVFLYRNFNIQDRVWNEYFHYLVKEQAVSIIPIVLHPKSRGYVKLASKIYEAPPIVNPLYLSDSDDAHALVKGIYFVQKLIEHDALRDLGAQIVERGFPGCRNHSFDSYSYWLCYVQHLTLTVYHPVGTCRLGDPKDLETVVDRKSFLVNGIDKLYVADASIMRNLPSGNPNAAVAMLAKKFMQVLMKRKNNDIEVLQTKKKNATKFPTSPRYIYGKKLEL